MNNNKYKSYIPPWLEESYIHRMKLIGQFFGIVLLTGFLVYVSFHYLSPLGRTIIYKSTQDSEYPIIFGPTDRITKETQNHEIFFRQTHDLIYFTTKMPIAFDEAKVRLIFQNTSEEQPLYIGFQDEAVWHYEKKLFDVPFLNDLSWNVVGEKPTLFQREKKYDSVQVFLQNPPEHALIGTYAYDSDIGDVSKTILPDYDPQNGETIIDTPLRGKHILYAYLEDEPFSLSLTKQDLNWYEDPDTMTVNIYKDNQQVYQTIVTDDGITNASGAVKEPQNVVLQNPGPDLPEKGIYKIVLDANHDTIIKEIRTNLHKIVFARSLFPVENTIVYPEVFASTAATTFYTNALMLSAKTPHNEGKQTVLIGKNERLELNQLNTEESITPKESFTPITTRKNDVQFNTFEGYNSFTPQQFFLPSKYHVSSLTKPSDVTFVDYILAEYTPSTKEGKWMVKEQTFDLRSAHINNGRLTWAIMAPQLQEKQKEIRIKEIEITLSKKPWRQWQ